MKRIGIVLTVIMLMVVISMSVGAAEDSKSYHFGFKKSKNGQLPSIDQEGFKDILMRQEAIFLGDTSKKELYLTFDNGYENGYTIKILDVLLEKMYQLPFF